MALVVVGTAIALNATGVPQYLQQRETAKDQRAVQDQATAQARAQAAQAERDFNRMNQKKPNLAAMWANNASAASAGAGSTMLTGPAGVDPSTLKLGKTTLLGA